MFDSLKAKAAEITQDVSSLSLKKMQDEVVHGAAWLKKETEEFPTQAKDWVTDQAKNHWREDGLVVLAVAATYAGVRLTYLQKGMPWLGVATELPGLIRGGLADRRLGLAMERDMEINPAWRRAALNRLSEKGIAAPTIKLRWPSIPEDK